MKTLLAAGALMLATASSALAFDADTQGIIDKQKAGKRVAITDVAHLMQTSERWCYDTQDGSCAWSEIYLSVGKTRVSFELSNAWDDDTDYAFTDKAVFTDDKICQTGFNWIANLRAMRHSDGGSIGGRQLSEFKIAMAEARPDLEEYDDCFDYLYLSSDPDQEIVTLLQRSYVDGVHDVTSDVEVSVHFNAEDAAQLTLRL